MTSPSGWSKASERLVRPGRLSFRDQEPLQLARRVLRGPAFPEALPDLEEAVPHFPAGAFRAKDAEGLAGEILGRELSLDQLGDKRPSRPGC